MPFCSDADRRRWADDAAARLRSTMFGPVEWVAETGSTNADLLARADDPDAIGAVLIADHQVAGRGRRDRTWTTAPGDALLLSTLLRPETDPSSWGAVTAAFSLAFAEACDAAACPGVAIKWPNDLVVGASGEHRKLAGILAQSRIGGQRVGALVVGVGLNVFSARLGNVPGAPIALDELGDAPARVDLVVGALTAVAPLLAAIDAGETDELWRRYRDRSATLGTEVLAHLDAETITGVASDVTSTGALVVQTAHGTREIVAADVVSVRPKAP